MKMKSYSEVADIVSKVQKLAQIKELLQKVLENIDSVKEKCELWIEDKENLSYTEVKQFINCKTSEALHKYFSQAGSNIENLAQSGHTSEPSDKENQTDDIEQSASLSQELQSLRASIDTLSSELNKCQHKLKDQETKNKTLEETSTNVLDATQDVDKRLNKLKEEVRNELQATSTFMSQCQTFSTEFKKIKEVHEKKMEDWSSEMIDLRNTISTFYQKQDGLEAEQENLNSKPRDKMLTQEDLAEVFKRVQRLGKDIETLRWINVPEFYCKKSGQSDVKCTGNCLHVIGHHEQQISEGGEADLLTHLADCNKNLGHKDFIPVDRFSLEHLPLCYQNNDMYELIKVVADLTVRVSVKMTSKRRPEFWPNTKIPYFVYNLKESQHLRTGSGIITDVMKGNNVLCSCHKCQHSDKPNIDWWRIEVQTAGSLVFDDIEANHTTIRLFYDTENCEDIVLNQEDITSSKSQTERSRWIKFLTCDRNLVQKIAKMIDQYNNLFSKVNISTEVENFMFIVSHPHGCCKQISIGQWKDRYNTFGRPFSNIFLYSTCTCPGSEGASVHCVDYGKYIHQGSLKSGLNYSCYTSS
ncbi:STE20-like serine/threonine-protein kinase isoform X2 [Biomphalaria glabrata]|nr:STE20-like serine/threonine-protein kinase isoform X2 [Biomphalaria glabrata]